MFQLSLISELGLLRGTLLLIFLLLASVISRALIQAYATPLRDVPGPWLAKFSRVWQLKAVHARTFQKTNLDLHRRYGKVSDLTYS